MYFGGQLLAIHKDLDGKQNLRCAMSGIDRAFENAGKSHLLAAYAESAYHNREPPLGGGRLLGREC